MHYESYMHVKPHDPIFFEWTPWFAWYPVKLLNGKWMWLEKIYWRYAIHYSPEEGSVRSVEYGTIFDLLQ